MRKTKEKTSGKVSTQNYTQMLGIGNQSPDTWNWHHYILIYGTKNTSKAELAKDQRLLPAN